MASQKLSIYTIKLFQDAQWNNILNYLLNQNTDQERCIINEQTDSYISGCYMMETLHNQTQYNIDDNCFELVPVKRLSILKFEVFIDNETLILWGGKRILTVFLTALDNASNHQISIEQKDTEFKLMVRKLIKNPEVDFVRMKIQDIIIDQGILVNCNVNLKVQNDPCFLVKKYLDNISQLSIILGQEPYKVSITIYSTGAIVVYKDRDDISDEIITIINDLFGGIK